MRARSCSLLLLGLAVGCPDDCEDQPSHYFSASGRWTLNYAQLVADPCDRPGHRGAQQDEPLLVGSRWCPDIGCVRDAPCHDTSTSHVVAGCYTVAVEGPAEVVDEFCVDLVGSGEVVFRLDRKPCEDTGMLLPEQFRLRSVGVDEVRGQLVPYLDTLALDYLVAETGEFPRDELRSKDATMLKLAADEPVHMAINLWAGERRVAWAGDMAELEVEVVRGEPVATLGEQATIALQFPEGSEAALTLVVGPTRVPLGRVRGVGLATLTELEVVVAHGPAPDGRSRVPMAVRAVARDGDGDLVHGARPTWEVPAGSFAFTPADLYVDGANHDYALLLNGSAEDDESTWCFPIPAAGARDYVGTIAARVADLHAEVDVTWTFEAEWTDLDDLYAGTFQRAPPGRDCQGPGFPDAQGCDCSASARGGAPLALLALLALGTARRRRLGRGRVRLASVASMIVLGCGPDPGDSESTNMTSTGGTTTAMPTTTATTGAATSATTEVPDVMSTGAVTTGPDGDGLDEHGPCPNGDDCAACAQSEGASVCGPQCREYGPGFVRCPVSPVQGQSICVWEDDYANPMCLIMCAENTDCPAPGMVCVTCPAQYESACDNLWGFTEKGPNICAWPGTPSDP